MLYYIICSCWPPPQWRRGWDLQIKLPSDEDLNAGKVLTTPYQWKMTKFRETAVITNGLSESMNNLLDYENAEVSDTPSNRDSVTSDNMDHLESVSQASIDLEEPKI